MMTNNHTPGDHIHGNRPQLSIIIPAWNEAERLPSCLEHVLEGLQTLIGNWEVVVVNDGSTDATDKIIEQYQERYESIRAVHLRQNSGKGAAVRDGIAAAYGQWMLVYDADAATPITELARLLPVVKSGAADVAIGSRVLKSPETQVQAKLSRQQIGWWFRQLVRPLIWPVEDSQCGFKLWSRPAAEAVFSQLRTRGYGFDVEALMLARQKGFKIAEIPINWRDVDGSKVDFIRDGWRVLQEVARLYARSFKS